MDSQSHRKHTKILQASHAMQLTLSFSLQTLLIVAPPVFGAFFCAIFFDNEIPAPWAERIAIWIKQIGIVGPIFTIRALFPVH